MKIAGKQLLDINRFITYMDIHTNFTRGVGLHVSNIGEICVARCNSQSGQYILMVAIYISHGKSLKQIQPFLFENLMIYTKEGSVILEKRFGEKCDDIPMILSFILINVKISIYIYVKSRNNIFIQVNTLVRFLRFQDHSPNRSEV